MNTNQRLVQSEFRNIAPPSMQLLNSQQIQAKTRQTQFTYGLQKNQCEKYEFNDSDEEQNKVEEELNARDTNQKDIQQRQSVNKSNNLDNQYQVNQSVKYPMKQTQLSQINEEDSQVQKANQGFNEGQFQPYQDNTNNSQSIIRQTNQPRNYVSANPSKIQQQQQNDLSIASKLVGQSTQLTQNNQQDLHSNDIQIKLAQSQYGGQAQNNYKQVSIYASNQEEQLKFLSEKKNISENEQQRMYQSNFSGQKKANFEVDLQANQSPINQIQDSLQKAQQDQQFMRKTLFQDKQLIDQQEKIRQTQFNRINIESNENVVQLVVYDKKNKQMRITEEAIAFLQNVKGGKVSFAFFISNEQVLKDQVISSLLGTKFKQPPQVQQEISINMYPKPLQSQFENMNIFLLDCPQDMQLQIIASLISSYQIYISNGQIDENQIAQIDFIKNTYQNIYLSYQENFIKSLCQSFLWIVTNFKIEQQGNLGIIQSQNYYLEKILHGDGIEVNEQNYSIRECLIKNFKQRECMEIDIQIIQATISQNFNSANQFYIADRFVEELKNKVKKNSELKSLQAKQLTSFRMIVILQAIYESFNQYGKIPDLAEIMDAVSHKQCDKAFFESQKLYTDLMSEKYNPENPYTIEDLNNILSQLKNQTLDYFYTNCGASNDDTYFLTLKQSLLQFILEKEKNMHQLNYDTAKIFNTQMWQQAYDTFQQKVMQCRTESAQYEITQEDFNLFLDTYNKKCFSYQAGEIFQELMTKVFPQVIGQIKQSYISENPDQANVMLSKLSKQNRDSSMMGQNESNLAKENEKLKEQLEQYKKKNELLQKDNIKKIENVAQTDEKLRKSVIDNQQKERQIKQLKNQKKSNCFCQ